MPVGLSGQPRVPRPPRGLGRFRRENPGTSGRGCDGLSCRKRLAMPQRTPPMALAPSLQRHTAEDFGIGPRPRSAGPTPTTPSRVKGREPVPKSSPHDCEAVEIANRTRTDPGTARANLRGLQPADPARGQPRHGSEPALPRPLLRTARIPAVQAAGLIARKRSARPRGHRQQAWAWAARGVESWGGPHGGGLN